MRRRAKGLSIAHPDAWYRAIWSISAQITADKLPVRQVQECRQWESELRQSAKLSYSFATRLPLFR